MYNNIISYLVAPVEGITKGEYNIINRGYSTYEPGEHDITLNDYPGYHNDKWNSPEFTDIFYDYYGKDFRPITASIACDGTVNEPNVAVGALDCLGCIGDNPFAVFKYIPQDDYDTEIEFDAADSLSCNNSITDYSWNFGDGYTDSGVQVIHTFEPGTYFVNLTVTNNLGNTNSKEKTITVLPSLEPGLNLYLNFNNNAIDLSGKGNDGVWNGELSYGEGQVKQAMLLDGTSTGSYLTIDNDSSMDVTNAFTFVGWAKKNNEDIGGFLFYKHVAYWIRIHDNYVIYRLYNTSDEDSGNRYAYSDSIDNTDWHHYAFKYNGSNVQIYLDGEEIGSSSFSGNIPATAWQLHIGKNPWGDTINGSIDEIKLYNKALSSSEIQAIYNAQKTECVDTPVLLNYISQWKQGSLEIAALMQKIGAWKTGTGCP